MSKINKNNHLGYQRNRLTNQYFFRILYIEIRDFNKGE